MECLRHQGNLQLAFVWDGHGFTKLEPYPPHITNADHSLPYKGSIVTIQADSEAGLSTEEDEVSYLPSLEEEASSRRSRDGLGRNP
jgi:hypothetical protein